MRKVIAVVLYVIVSISSALGQNTQLALFVYSDNDIPTNALRSQLTALFLSGENSIYGIVDRTDEIYTRLTQEYQYQGSGLVKDDQLVTIGNQLAANYICVVAITYYPQFEQYFFDGKIIDVSTRQIINNTLYPNDEQSVVKSLDPQTQIRVGKELAKQLGLFSSEQLAAERRKQLLEKEARERAEKEARGLQIGDVYEGIRIYGNSFRIGYLDATGKHGIAFRIGEKAHSPFVSSASSKLETPTCSQLLLLYKNKKRLCLHDEYWSSEIAKKEVHGFGNANWTYPWYYTIDFSSGQKMKRRTGFDDPHFYNIEIIQF